MCAIFISGVVLGRLINMVVTITDSRIRNTVYESVYDIINSDKSGYNASSTPTLIGGHPDLSTISFPTIIINPIEVNESDYTADHTSSLKDIAVIVEIYTKSEKDLDNIADGVSNSLRGDKISGAFLNAVNESNGVSFVNESKIKQKTLTFMFRRR